MPEEREKKGLLNQSSLLARLAFLVLFLGVVFNRAAHPAGSLTQQSGVQNTLAGSQVVSSLLAPGVSEEAGSLTKNTVERVGRLLVAHPAASRLPYQFSFHLLPDRQFVNAFIMPAGQVFITQGLLSRLKTEGELAGVLGHEIGHFLVGSSIESLDERWLSLTPGSSAPRGSQGSETAENGLSDEDLKDLENQRATELQADFWSVCILAGAGYDPQELVGLMEVLEDAMPNEQRPAEFLSDHPAPANRIEYIQEIIAHPERCPQ